MGGGGMGRSLQAYVWCGVVLSPTWFDRGPERAKLGGAAVLQPEGRVRHSAVATWCKVNACMALRGQRPPETTRDFYTCTKQRQLTPSQANNPIFGVLTGVKRLMLSTVRGEPQKPLFMHAHAPHFPLLSQTSDGQQLII